jgi:phage tail-like protein
MPRERPYPQFNFLVTIDGAYDNGEDIFAGFQECGPISTEVGVAEYRTGNEKTNNVRKITMLNKATDVTLKRGIIGHNKLYELFEQTRNGQNVAGKQVKIELRSEDRTSVQTWLLSNARIIKYVSGPLSAKGTDVAVEEATFTCERVTMEFKD